MCVVSTSLKPCHCSNVAPIHCRSMHTVQTQVVSTEARRNLMVVHDQRSNRACVSKHVRWVLATVSATQKLTINLSQIYMHGKLSVHYFFFFFPSFRGRP